MRNVLLALAVLISIPAIAGLNNLDAVKNNPEVKSAIASFEANRTQKCSEITANNTRIGKNGAVKVLISCNQYDENGEPQANGHCITLRGYLYDSVFGLGSVSMVGAE